MVCWLGIYHFYHLGSFQVVSHNCSAFTTAFNSAYAVGGATLAVFVENFDHDVFLKIKINLANTLVPVGTNPYTEGYVTFKSCIQVNCYKWCYIENGQTTCSTKISGGSDGCSEQSRACRDEGKNLVLHSFYDNTYPTHFPGPIIFGTGLLPGRCTSESDCEFRCQD